VFATPAAAARIEGLPDDPAELKELLRDLELRQRFERLSPTERSRARDELRIRVLEKRGWTFNRGYGDSPDGKLRDCDPAAAAREEGLADDPADLYEWLRDLELGRPHRRADADQAQRTIHRAGAGTKTRAEIGQDPVVTYVPVEDHITERAAVSQDAKEREALRAESGLVERFKAYLEQLGHATSSVVIQIDRENIRADLFDRTERILYEAKATPDRSKIRMAIGQLLDYGRFIAPKPQCRVLLPSQPNPDLCQLLALAGIGATWSERDGWRDVDPSALASLGAPLIDPRNRADR
jgi:hypothetical protein